MKSKTPLSADDLPFNGPVVQENGNLCCIAGLPAVLVHQAAFLVTTKVDWVTSAGISIQNFALFNLSNQNNQSMRVFVTGATGFVGSAVVPELIAAGHRVTGLARNEKAAQALTAAGAEVHRGDLEDIDSLKHGAAAADGVIHTGFIHDFTRFQEVCEIDRRAIEAMGSVLGGTDKPFVVTSGIGLFATGQLVTEEDKKPASGVNPRAASEAAVDKLTAQGVRVSVVRLAPSVHGEGDHHGFVPILINIAREKGASVYNERLNSWCAVHRLDAAKLYRLALEKEAAPGTRYHGVAEESILFQAIAQKIGQRLHVPAEARTAAEAAQYFGWFAHFAAMDIRASSLQTRDSLGWEPTQPGLLEDMDGNIYFTR